MRFRNNFRDKNIKHCFNHIYFSTMDIILPILKSDALVAEKSECCEEAEDEDDFPE